MHEFTINLIHKTLPYLFANQALYADKFWKSQQLKKKITKFRIFLTLIHSFIGSQKTHPDTMCKISNRKQCFINWKAQSFQKICVPTLLLRTQLHNPFAIVNMTNNSKKNWSQSLFLYQFERLCFDNFVLETL